MSISIFILPPLKVVFFAYRFMNCLTMSDGITDIKRLKTK